MASASTTTEPRIWPLPAPSVRSIPNSLIRCATVVEKVLKSRRAPTKRATKAKTSSAIRRKPMSSRIWSELRSAFSLAVSTSSPGSPKRRCTRRFNVSSETPLSAAIEIWSNSPRLPGVRGAAGRIHPGEAGPAEGGPPHPGQADDAVGGDPFDRGQLERVAEAQPGLFGGPLVERGLAGGAGGPALNVGQGLQRTGQGRSDELGREFGADRLVVRVEESAGSADRARGHPHPFHPLHLRQHSSAEARHLAGFLADLLFRRDHDLGLRQRVFEDFVEGGEGRVGDDVGAGDEGDADHRREDRGQGADTARPEALEGEAGQAAGGGGARLSSRPARRTIRRSAWAAASGSWVTMITVWPNSSTAWRSSFRTSALAFESRLPVGSSAKTTAGLETRARATATRCCWPPESSEGRWVRRSSRPTVRTNCSSHSWSGLRPAIESGSTRFSSAVRTGSRLKNWKTKPSLSRRSLVSSASSSAVISSPSRTTVPPVGLSSPARMCIRGDVPEPEGPQIGVR